MCYCSEAAGGPTAAVQGGAMKKPSEKKASEKKASEKKPSEKKRPVMKDLPPRKKKNGPTVEDAKYIKGGGRPLGTSILSPMGG